MTGETNPYIDVKDVTWIDANGSEMKPETWDNVHTRCFGMLLDGRAQTTGIKRRGSDATLLIVFNAHHDGVKFRLPLYYEEYGWTRLIDTNAPGLPPRKFRGGAAYKAAGRSLLMFERIAVEAKDKTGERVAREALPEPEARP